MCINNRNIFILLLFLQIIGQVKLTNGMFIGVALLLHTPNHELLMALRDDDPKIFYPNTWCIFTGKLEECDLLDNLRNSLEKAVLREIGEELGILADGHIDSFVPQGLKLEHQRQYVDQSQNYAFYQYIFSSGLNIPVNKLVLMEGKELRLFGSKNIAELKIAPSFADVILDYFYK